MELENKTQEECYRKVAGFLRELYGEKCEPMSDEPGFVLRYGSAIAIIQVRPWHDDAVVSVQSWVVTGAELDSGLLRFLLDKNHDIAFAAFEIDSDGDIALNCDIVGTTCDKNELRYAVESVVTLADDFDDQIVARWGGQRALDRTR